MSTSDPLAFIVLAGGRRDGQVATVHESELDGPIYTAEVGQDLSDPAVAQVRAPRSQEWVWTGETDRYGRAVFRARG